MYKLNTKTKAKSNRGRKPGLGSEIASFFKPFKEEKQLNPDKFLDDRVKMFIRKYFLKSKRLMRKYYFLYLQYIFLCDQEKKNLNSNRKANILREILSRDYIVIDKISQKLKADTDFIEKLTKMLLIQYIGIDKEKKSYYFHLLFDEIIEYIKKGVRNKKNLAEKPEVIIENNIICCENQNSIISYKNSIPLDNFDSMSINYQTQYEQITSDFTESQEEPNEDGKLFAVTSQILDSCYLFKDLIPEDTNTEDSYLTPPSKKMITEKIRKEKEKILYCPSKGNCKQNS